VVFVLVISSLVALGSVAGARSTELHRFIYQQNRKNPIRTRLDESDFARLIRIVFMVLAVTAGLIGALAAIRLISGPIH
jgi:hypothetical protein